MFLFIFNVIQCSATQSKTGWGFLALSHVCLLQCKIMQDHKISMYVLWACTSPRNSVSPQMTISTSFTSPRVEIAGGVSEYFSLPRPGACSQQQQRHERAPLCRVVGVPWPEVSTVANKPLSVEATRNYVWYENIIYHDITEYDHIWPPLFDRMTNWTLILIRYI